MSYRNLSDLYQSEYFRNFIAEYNLDVKLIAGRIFIKTDRLLIFIYGYYTETWIYISIYDFSEKRICYNTVSIEYILPVELVKKIYIDREETYQSLISQIAPPGTLLAEATFFARIDILKQYIKNLLNYKLIDYKEFFDEIGSDAEAELESILNQFSNSRNRSTPVSDFYS